MSTSHRDPAVQAEMRRIRSSRPRYGYDARRRARARQDAADAVKRRRRHYEAIIILVAAALFIIGWDHEVGHEVHLNRPVQVTGTPAP